jgi:hypothetical protein
MQTKRSFTSSTQVGPDLRAGRGLKAPGSGLVSPGHRALRSARPALFVLGLGRLFAGAKIVSCGTLLVLALESGSDPARAQDAVPKPPASPLASLAPEERTRYAKLAKDEWELNARIQQLIELADDHLKRSTDAKIGFPDRSRWESDLAQELRDQAAKLLTQLNDSTKQRLAIETSHGLPAGAAPSPGPLEETKALNPDELAYVVKLDTRLLKVRQDLANVVDAGKAIYSQLQTNTSTEAVTRASILIEENNVQTRQLEREVSELELKKLEFRALRK